MLGSEVAAAASPEVHATASSVAKGADAASNSRLEACQAPQRLQGFSLLVVCHGASICLQGPQVSHSPCTATVFAALLPQYLWCCTLMHSALCSPCP